MRSIMYLLQQPRTLESMAMKKIGEWIASHAEIIEPSLTTLVQRYPTKAQELLSRQIEMMRNHIQCRLPGRYYDEAMTELKRTLCDLLRKLWREDIRTTILRRMIETLFTKNITSFSCDFSEWEKFGNSCHSESHLIPGLTHLTFHSHYTDHDLKLVEKRFQLIETLDLSNSEINDDCIDILIRLKNLRSVKFSDRSVTERHIGTLLTSCPNIEHIIGTAIEIGCVLEIIVNTENYDGRRFNLKSYRNKCDATLEQQQLVVKLCPSIEKMQLKMYTGKDYENPKKYLNTLRDLQNLHELELFNCEFYTYEIKDLLEVRGNNLVCLCLSQVSEIDFSALKHISVMCPNLQSLDLIRCEYTDLEDTEQNDVIFCGVEMPPLIHLKKVSVNRAYDFEYFVKRYIIFLLSGCPNIENINILNVGLRDGNNFMLEVLEKNPTKLKYLRELRICQKLSESVIAQIVENCVNHPEIMLCG